MVFRKVVMVLWAKTFWCYGKLWCYGQKPSGVMASYGVLVKTFWCYGIKKVLPGISEALYIMLWFSKISFCWHACARAHRELSCEYEYGSVSPPHTHPP